jgi:hypothetical protein
MHSGGEFEASRSAWSLGLLSEPYGRQSQSIGATTAPLRRVTALGDGNRLAAGAQAQHDAVRAMPSRPNERVWSRVSGGRVGRRGVEPSPSAGARGRLPISARAYPCRSRRPPVPFEPRLAGLARRAGRARTRGIGPAREHGRFNTVHADSRNPLSDHPGSWRPGRGSRVLTAVRRCRGRGSNRQLCRDRRRRCPAGRQAG